MKCIYNKKPIQGFEFVNKQLTIKCKIIGYGCYASRFNVTLRRVSKDIKQIKVKSLRLFCSGKIANLYYQNTWNLSL